MSQDAAPPPKILPAPSVSSSYVRGTLLQTSNLGVMTTIEPVSTSRPVVTVPRPHPKMLSKRDAQLPKSQTMMSILRPDLIERAAAAAAAAGSSSGATVSMDTTEVLDSAKTMLTTLLLRQQEQQQQQLAGELEQQTATLVDPSTFLVSENQVNPTLISQAGLDALTQITQSGLDTSTQIPQTTAMGLDALTQISLTSTQPSFDSLNQITTTTGLDVLTQISPGMSIADQMALDALTQISAENGSGENQVMTTHAVQTSQGLIAVQENAQVLQTEDGVVIIVNPDGTVQVVQVLHLNLGH